MGGLQNSRMALYGEFLPFAGHTAPSHVGYAIQCHFNNWPVAMSIGEPISVFTKAEGWKDFSFIATYRTSPRPQAAWAVLVLDSRGCLQVAKSTVTWPVHYSLTSKPCGIEVTVELRKQLVEWMKSLPVPAPETKQKQPPRQKQKQKRRQVPPTRAPSRRIRISKQKQAARAAEAAAKAKQQAAAAAARSKHGRKALATRVATAKAAAEKERKKKKARGCG